MFLSCGGYQSEISLIAEGKMKPPLNPAKNRSARAVVKFGEKEKRSPEIPITDTPIEQIFFPPILSLRTPAGICHRVRDGKPGEKKPELGIIQT
jgi:hypothetical protein